MFKTKLKYCLYKKVQFAWNIYKIIMHVPRTSSMSGREGKRAFLPGQE